MLGAMPESVSGGLGVGLKIPPVAFSYGGSRSFCSRLAVSGFSFREERKVIKDHIFPRGRDYSFS